MIHRVARTNGAKSISADFCRLDFSWPDSAAPIPGQFFTIRVSDSCVPLLRRPFAFSGYDVDKSEASMIFQRRGPGTEILAALGAGESIDAIGPLGKGFRLDVKGPSILVAGGIGLGPMLFLARELHRLGREIVFVFGCRRKSQLPEAGVFDGLSPVICTDDGSEGFAGTSIDFLGTLDKKAISGATIFACGPGTMLRACHEFAAARKLLCQVSMEQTLGCGVGACMGCVVRVKGGSGYARVCHEGPVFESGEIVWD